MGLTNSITVMVSDVKSKHLLVGQGNGDVTFLKCSLDKEWDMIPVNQSPNAY